MPKEDPIIETFRNKLIKMHEEDNNKHALQWFLNDIFELHEISLKEQKRKIIKEYKKKIMKIKEANKK